MGLWATSVEDSEKRNLQSKELLRKSLLFSKDWEILVGNQEISWQLILDSENNSGHLYLREVKAEQG